MSNAVWVIERKNRDGEWISGVLVDAFGTEDCAMESLVQLRQTWPDRKYRVRKYRRCKR